MATNTIKSEKARFDTKLPLEQKLLFEKAARLGGYRNLTDFIIATVQVKAKEIVSESEQVLVSQRDSEIFFNAIMNPAKPNEALQAAANDFKSLLSE